RVERAAGLLVHHGHRPRPQQAQVIAAQRRDILTGHADRPGADPSVAGQVARDRERHRGLAGAGLADQPERLTPPDLERAVPNGERFGTPHVVAHVDVRGVHDDALGQPVADARRRYVHGHRMSTASIESPMRLTATTSEAIARAGNNVSHQYPAARYW